MHGANMKIVYSVFCGFCELQSDRSVKLTTQLRLVDPTEIMREWNDGSTPAYAFMACTGTTVPTSFCFKNFNIVWLHNMRLRCGRLSVNKC